MATQGCGQGITEPPGTDRHRGRAPVTLDAAYDQNILNTKSVRAIGPLTTLLSSPWLCSPYV